MNQLLAEFGEQGFVVIENLLEEKIVSDLQGKLANLEPSNSVSRKNETIYGVRNLLNISPEIREFSQSKIVQKVAEKFIGENAKIVRAIYFDKTAEANWKVPWHQDLTISVDKKNDAYGFSAWTQKAGINHVQPPIEILEKMLTLRFHLDDTDESNGALKIIAKSHRNGRLSAKEIKSWREANEMRVCRVKKGDCLVMRPLILHSSSAGTSPKNRRVIHFEFSADELPKGLNWYGS
ncbi:MAG TPA: phytanoyl-CoA dioxygenase family protein [Pyrinomonadaceae bacterium]|nr:phytanoyl-CoA dioxygenase family protein [Pyrinomonadaceae bacterium]